MKQKKTKKIVLCVTNDLLTDQRVNKVATSLHNAGYMVRLVGRSLQKHYPEHRFHITRFKLPFRKGFLFYATYNIRLFFHLLFSNDHVIVANDLDTLAACFAAARLRGKKLVYDSHEYFTEVPELIGRQRVRKVWLFVERLIFPRLQHCYTVCNSIAEAYHQKYGVPLSVVRNVPFRRNLEQNPSSPMQLNIPTDKKIILYQGALNVGRGIEHVIQAMPYINDAVFVIAGIGDIMPALQQLTNDMQLQQKVYFVGRIIPQHLSSLTDMAHVGISLQEDTGLSYRYVLPNRLFDYIQAHVPVLVSALPEMSNIVQQYNIGIVTASHEPEILAQYINNILYNNDLRSEWKTELQRAAYELCWENEEKTLLRVYENI